MPTVGTGRPAWLNCRRSRCGCATASPRSARHTARRRVVGSAPGHADSGHRGRAADPRFLRLGLEAEGFVVDAAEDGAVGLRARARRLVRARDPRPAPAPASTACACSRSCGRRGRTCRCSSSPPARTCRRSCAASISARATTSPKPFSFDELVARVRVHFAAAATRRDGTPLAAGALELDLARRQAQVEERVVDLSDREFRLLYHLVSHPGEVVSRERLLSEVWGYSFDPGSNVVDVCVRRLRKKLGCPTRRSRRCGMPVTAWPRPSRGRDRLGRSRRRCLAAMIAWPSGRRSRSTSSGSA